MDTPFIIISRKPEIVLLSHVIYLIILIKVIHGLEIGVYKGSGQKYSFSVPSCAILTVGLSEWKEMEIWYHIHMLSDCCRFLSSVILYCVRRILAVS